MTISRVARVSLAEMISKGTSASVLLTVTDSDTAIALGSGDIAVLGTPRLVALCEQAAVAALAETLPDGATTVGITVSLDHLVATGVGGSVVASATVTGVDGRKVSFSLQVLDGDTVVASGTHVRVVVDRARFTDSVGI